MKLLKMLLIIIFVAVAAITVVVAKDVLFGANGVFANPNQCAPGQEKKEGCKWVQHRVTGKCQWLPEDAVASPWQEVPENTCPALPEPTKTSIVEFPTSTATSASISTCTATAAILPTSTATIAGVPSATPKPKDPGPKADPADPLATSTATPPCDQCRAAQQQADALSTMAAAQVTRNAWDMRP